MSKKMKPFSNKGFREEDIIFCAWDTETDGLGGDLLFITACSPDGEYEYQGDAMVHEFFDLLSQHPYPCVWYAHHAQYDWRYIIEYIQDNQFHCEIGMRTESDIYQIIIYIDGARIVMRDSMAVFPNKLSKFADTFCPEFPKGEIDFDKETFDPSNEEHRAYARRDALILRVGMPRFNAMIQKHFGVNLGHTTAGTAMKAWQATIPDGVMYDPSKNDEAEKFIRQAYYGGLVFLTTTRAFHAEGDNHVAETHDINSSYPAQMIKHGVPGGRMVRCDDYLSGQMGIYRVRVTAPDDLIIPILPRRNDRGSMRWHRGSFETTVTSSELIFATQHGYTVDDIYEGYAWEERIFPFEEYIGLCKWLRHHFGRDTPEDILAKLLQNALYGKYGSRRERHRVFVPECDEEMIGAMPLGDGYFWIIKELAESLRCIPQWAVFITAHARLTLMQAAYAVGPQNVIYGDTDSLTVLKGHRQHFDNGNEYGQWKLEKEWRSFRAIAPKVYSGQLMDGKWKGAAKGLPKKSMGDKEWESLLFGNKVRANFLSLPSLRVAMNNGITPARSASRISTDIRNSQNWELHGDLIRPRMAT